MKLPQFPQSYWIESTELPSFPILAEDVSTDIVIVGAGITGITLAYLLSKQGKKITLLDAGKILNGTTGHTTAKITCQHQLIYDELISHFGLQAAKQYYDSNNEALEFIRHMIHQHHIECHYEEQDAWVYTSSTDEVTKLKKEFEAYKQLEIPGEYVESLESLPLPYRVKGALKMNNQAQFHPLEYLKKLLELAVQQGVKVYEQTTALSVEMGEPSYVLIKDNHKITAKHIVDCSHYPFYDDGEFYFFRMYAETSYAICIKPKQQLESGMYINVEKPSRSIRSIYIDGEQHLIIGGETHATGQGDISLQPFEALEQFAEQTFGIESILYRWSTQDYTTLDKLPFIGLSNQDPNLYVCTGYKKWGMTTGTAAALLIDRLIRGEASDYEEMYSPHRFHSDPSIKTFSTYVGNVVKHFIKGKFEQPSIQPEDLKPGEGAAVLFKFKRAGAYRDNNGQLFIVDTTCTHMGCEVQWNSGDLTWDCPCHGSRFSYSGDVLDGPAEKPLPKLHIND